MPSCNTYHLTGVSLTLDMGVSLHGCSSKAQPLLLTLDEGYLLTTTVPDLQHGISPEMYSWREKVWASPPHEKEQNKSDLIILVSSFGSLCSFRQIICFLFPHLTYPGTLLSVHVPLSQDGSRSEGFWEEQDSL